MADVVTKFSLRSSSSLLASLSSSFNSLQPNLPPQQRFTKRASHHLASSISFIPTNKIQSFQVERFTPGTKSKVQTLFFCFGVCARITETDQPKWWERYAGPNMVDIHSTDEFLEALRQAGERLVIVEFYATWCASCRALYPKLCRTVAEHPEILFLKVNFDENKPMCKSLNVKVLPNFHFYRGADGQLETFSCSLAKFQKIKDAIERHNTERCSLGPPTGVGDLINLGSVSAPQSKQAEASST